MSLLAELLLLSLRSKVNKSPLLLLLLLLSDKKRNG